MAKFNELNNNINTIMMNLISSQSLCKLLYYTSEDALERVDVDNPYGLIMNRIFPYPRIPDTTEKAGSYMCVYYDIFRLTPYNHSIKDVSLRFDILVHTEQWKINEGLRPLALLNEIDEIFNGELRIGIKKLQFDRARFLRANTDFTGYEVYYSLNSGS